jgi:hypothetical protein
MKKKLNKLEPGQILVILTVGILALLAFTALAVDGGMYLSDRRYDQNAADASAFAGAQSAGKYMTDTLTDSDPSNDINYSNFPCYQDASGNYIPGPGLQPAIDAAIASAKARGTDNNFPDLITGLSTQHGVEVTCGIDTSFTYPRKYLDVHVMVTTYVQTTFAHLFYSGPFRNTVEAVTRVEPAEGVGLGLAIVALDEACGGSYGGLYFSGTGDINIYDSGAHSNACIDCSGGAVVHADDALNFNTEPHGTSCAAGEMYPPPTEVDDKIERMEVDIDCGSSWPTIPDPVDDVRTLEPGNYNTIRVNDSKETLILKSGLYCIHTGMNVNGDGVIVDAIDAEPSSTTGVTLYSLDGNITINGSSVLKMWAVKDPPEGNNALPGMLIYMDPSNTGTITLNGGSETLVQGTIYAPYGTVKITGNNASDKWLAQIVANEIIVEGTSELNITYNGDNVYWGDSFAELFK